MAKDITLKTRNGETRYPKTVTAIVYENGTGKTLQTIIDEMRQVDSATDTRTQHFKADVNNLDTLKNKTDIGLYNYVGTGWRGSVSVCYDSADNVSQIALSSSTPSYNGNTLTWISAQPCAMARTYTNGAWSHWEKVGAPVVNDLTTGGTDKALSAEMGKTLKEGIDALGPKCDQNTTNIANLQQEIDAITPIVIDGDVTNAPDEEDLTMVNNVIKFKGRSTAVNQKGYKILRKGASLASQITDVNTIYEVRYAFDLNGGTLTIPSGCTLAFNGGFIDGGTINGAYTAIKADLYKIFGDQLTLTGTWSVKNVMPEWFGAKSDGITDCSGSFQKCLTIFNNIYLSIGSYLLNSQIVLPQNSTIVGQGAQSVIECRYNGPAFLFQRPSANKPITIVLSKFYANGTHPNYFDDVNTEDIDNDCDFLRMEKGSYVYRASITDCSFRQFRTALYFNMGFFVNVDKCLFTSCYDAIVITEGNASSFTNNDFKFLFHTGITFKGRRSGGFEESVGITISGNDFSDIGFAGIWILSKFGNSAIIGNYFEKSRREDTEDRNSEIIIGDKDGTEELDYTPYVNSCTLRYNSGLWAPRGIYVCNAQLNRCHLGGNIYAFGTSTGEDNTGSTENSALLSWFKDANLYRHHYKYGVLSDAENCIRQLDLEDVCVPRRSSLTIKQFSAQYGKLLYYASSHNGITLTIKSNDDVYIAGDATGGVVTDTINEGLWDNKSNMPISTAANKTYSIILNNTTNANINVDVDIRYMAYKKA